MDSSTLNIWAILLASLVGFAVGALWYSPLLFANVWMRETGLDEAKIRSANMPKIFSLSFVFLFIMAFCLAMFLNTPETHAGTGALYGFLTGFGWLLFAFAVTGLFEQRSWRYILIHGGYWTVVFTLMGLILGAWR
ncbi:DUF1761 domain-containing protein [Saccharospirillum impatiens]|uniref:DUF1761 domain-containing protein n=1 Tax=Saccharospirillum impatiens TaxID=169438 RepID=UPI00041F7D09|nr:DUF1761 domain-containing protein [Saccharospirillum impatiens]